MYILLQASDQGGSYTTILFMGGLFVVFYLFMMRPQQRKRKEQKAYLQSLKVGDMIVTLGGLHGKILNISEATLQIEIDKGTKVTIERQSISYEASKRSQ